MDYRLFLRKRIKIKIIIRNYSRRNKILEIIIRIINALITATTTLVLVRYIYGLVIVFKNKIKTFEFAISNLIAFLVAMIVNLSVIYGLIWIIKFFAIRV